MQVIVKWHEVNLLQIREEGDESQPAALLEIEIRSDRRDGLPRLLKKSYNKGSVAAVVASVFFEMIQPGSQSISLPRIKISWWSNELCITPQATFCPVLSTRKRWSGQPPTVIQKSDRCKNASYIIERNKQEISSDINWYRDS